MGETPEELAEKIFMSYPALRGLSGNDISDLTEIIEVGTQIGASPVKIVFDDYAWTPGTGWVRGDVPLSDE